MIPILTASQIKENDEKTIFHHFNNDSWALMEMAAEAFCRRYLMLFGLQKATLVLVGSGNNGGDGLAIARILYSWGVDVAVCLIVEEKKGTPGFEKNKSLLQEGIFLDISKLTEWQNINKSGIVIDAIFGSGLSRPITGKVVELIQEVNKGLCTKVSVDIASGLFADSPTAKESIVFKADFTISFETPHLAFFLPENEQYVGEWYLELIGWKKSEWFSIPTKYYYSEASDFVGLLKKRPRFIHKGAVGRGLLVAGSSGKAGAAILASRAALRSGIGLLTVHTCKSVGHIVQHTIPEAMVHFDSCDDWIKNFASPVSSDICAIGPGLGLKEETQLGFFEYSKSLPTGCKYILDADALTMLSIFPQLIKQYSRKAWITPHLGECDRLLGKSENSFERLEKLRSYCQTSQISGVLKGANSACVSTEGVVYFNCSGNPGMATGGSGDVLTGIMLAIAVQLSNPLDVLRLSVYLHGLAGDLAVKKYSEISLLPSDIIDHLPSAINTIYGSNCIN